MKELEKYIFWSNTVLKNKSDLEFSKAILKHNNLELHPRVDGKNWDSLVALNLILMSEFSDARILDAGGRYDSPILFWLKKFGYENLYCMNLEFNEDKTENGIHFIAGDITKSRFTTSIFNVVTCISVVEHGVSIDDFFSEMRAIIKKNGLLIISTDYWNPKINTDNKFAYGNQINIFDEHDIKRILDCAFYYGFELYPGNQVDLETEEKVIRWDKHDLDYTFLTMSFLNKKK